MVDVGGRKLHLHCAGAGAPLVILDECYGCTANSWGDVQARIARFARVCEYDRAGVGYSEPASPKPRHLRDIVADLHSLLATIAPSQRVVFVGLGEGTLYGQVYAREYPRSVLGLVLVDGVSKDIYQRYWKAYPPDVLRAQADDMLQSGEGVDIDTDSEAMPLLDSPDPLGSSPLVVISHGVALAPLPGVSAEQGAKIADVYRQIQAEEPRLSSNSTNVVALGVEWVPDEAPDLVVRAVREVITSARSGVPVRRSAVVGPEGGAGADAGATAGDAPPPSADVLPAPAPPDHPILDGVVPVGGGVSLHIHCAGTGAPTVVMDAGAGGDGNVWRKVEPELTTTTRTCVYDRAGLGYSSHPAPRPHSNLRMAEELHTLLVQAGIVGPYVLVGHSMGGMNVRLFAAEHLDEVAGMVLVDSRTEEYQLRSLSLITPEQVDRARAGLAKHPEGLTFDTANAGYKELAARSRSIGDRPLVALTRGRFAPLQPGETLTPEQNERMHRLWQSSQADVAARLSTNSLNVVAEKCGHFIQQEAPKLVLASIRQVVDAVRTHAPLNRAALEALAHDPPAP